MVTHLQARLALFANCSSLRVAGLNPASGAKRVAAVETAVRRAKVLKGVRFANKPTLTGGLFFTLKRRVVWKYSTTWTLYGPLSRPL